VTKVITFIVMSIMAPDLLNSFNLALEDSGVNVLLTSALCSLTLCVLLASYSIIELTSVLAGQSTLNFAPDPVRHHLIFHQFFILLRFKL
jgi:hypothetical protein